jgi:hypothetical protein
VKPTGFDDDLVVTTDVETLTKWHMGWLSLDEARRTGRLSIEGPRELVRAFSGWNWLSRFSEVAPARRQPTAMTQPGANRGLLASEG